MTTASVTAQAIEVLVNPTGGRAEITHVVLEVLRQFFVCNQTQLPAPPVGTGQYTPVVIRRLRQSPHAAHGLNWIYYDWFELDLDTGRGLSDGQGRDPQIMLQWSDDGGHTWSHEQWMSAGPQGQYARRALWQRLGRSRDRVFRIVASDPVPWQITDALLGLKDGES